MKLMTCFRRLPGRAFRARDPVKVLRITTPSGAIDSLACVRGTGDPVLVSELVLEETDENSVDGANDVLAKPLNRRPVGRARGSTGGATCDAAMPWWPAPSCCSLAWFESTGISTGRTSVSIRLGTSPMFSFSGIDDSGIWYCCTFEDFDTGAGIWVMIGSDCGSLEWRELKMGANWMADYICILVCLRYDRYEDNLRRSHVNVYTSLSSVWSAAVPFFELDPSRWRHRRALSGI